MSRIDPLAPGSASERQKALLESARKKMGAVPNLIGALAHAPAALEAYLAQSEALSRGSLDRRLREQIAVAVAGLNTCDYCASAHTALGQKAGLPDHELADNLRGKSGDPAARAALEFARTIVRNRGRVTDGDLAAVRAAGFDTGQIVEIVAHVGLNVFTNYFNHVAETDVDFPLVRTSDHERAA